MAVLSDYTEAPSSLIDVLPKRVESCASTLISNEPFVPRIGRCYDVNFGRVTIGNQTGAWSARIKATGPHPSKWIDLDTGEVLDSELRTFVVQSFNETDCPP